MIRKTWLNGLVLALVLTVCVPVITYAGDDQPALTADQALKQLQDGNQRFVDGKPTHPRSDVARRTETVKDGQHPVASILGCSDSRAPLECVFDQGIGDIFVIRVAGNVAGVDELGTLEYGAGHLHTPLIVVLGHTKCGAVTAAVQKADATGHLKPLIEQIQPAVERAEQKKPKPEGDALVQAAITENVWQGIADLLTKSEEVRDLVGAGKVKVVGAVYDLETGKVQWLGPHPEQARLVQAASKHEPKEDKAKADQPKAGPGEKK
jgi:carbonic anhydrase